jgi:hypothetical protein
VEGESGGWRVAPNQEASMDQAASFVERESSTHRREYSDTLTELFGPEIVLPEQIITGYRNDSYVSGEKALMLAVLEDGIRCFQEHLRNPRLNPRLLSEQAEEWISAEDWDWPFSFNNVCETLGLDPEALRGALLCWKAKLTAMQEKPSPQARKVYRLHLRTRRAQAVRWKN